MKEELVNFRGTIWGSWTKLECGHQQQPWPENQDVQHTPNQPGTLEVFPSFRGRKTPPKIPKYQKTPRLHELFRKFARTFPCSPVTWVRNPTEIVQKNSFRWTFLFWVDFSGGLSSCDHCNVMISKRLVNQTSTSDPHPPHTRKHQQKPGMWPPNASKQGKLDSCAAIFLFISLPCMWGLGFQNDSPRKSLVNPSVIFVLQFSACSWAPLLHKRRDAIAHKGAPRGSSEQNTCLALYCCAWGHWQSVIFMWVQKQVPMRLSGTHKIACPRVALQQWHLDARKSVPKVRKVRQSLLFGRESHYLWWSCTGQRAEGQCPQTYLKGFKKFSEVLSGNADGSRNPWAIKFHGRPGCWCVTLQLRDHSSWCRKKQFHLPGTSRPLIWQLLFLVSHYSAIGSTISCDAPYSAVAAIVCDTTENTMRQGYCYTCLAIGGGGILVGSLSFYSASLSPCNFGPMKRRTFSQCLMLSLVAPCRAILRYYRCDTSGKNT